MANEQDAAGLAPYRRTLDADGRDVDSKLVPKGTSVLCHPLAPAVFKEDTAENGVEFRRRDCTWTDDLRRQVWFPAAAGLPAECRKSLDAARAAREAFAANLRENMLSAVGAALPEINLPLWFVLVPWEARIRSVREAADLTAEWVAAWQGKSGAPPDLAWPAEWTDLAVGLNQVKVYAMAGMRAEVHVVALLRPHPGRPPALEAPGPEVAEGVRTAYEQWLASTGRSRPAFVYFTLGAARPWSKELQGCAAGDHWMVYSHSPNGQAWETRRPPRFADRRSLADFTDRLAPETRQQRISRIKDVVDDLLDTQDGNVHLELVKKRTGYRRTAIRDAFAAMQERGGYRVYRTRDKVLAIDRNVALPRANIPMPGSMVRTVWQVAIASVIMAVPYTVGACANWWNVGEPPKLKTIIISCISGYISTLFVRRLTRHRESED